MRSLTPREKGVLFRLLEAEFPGRDTLKDQMQHARVEEIDSNGSLRFFECGSTRSSAKYRVPVEGFYEDSDGIQVRILLHVINGQINELEIYKDDSSKVLRLPDAEFLSVV